MSPVSKSIGRIALMRIVAIVAVGLLAYAAAAVLEIDPLAPTLIATLIMLVKLAVTYRTDDTD